MRFETCLLKSHSIVLEERNIRGMITVRNKESTAIVKILGKAPKHSGDMLRNNGQKSARVTFIPWNVTKQRTELFILTLHLANMFNIEVATTVLEY